MKTRLKGNVPPRAFGWPFLGEMEFLRCQRRGSRAVFFDTRVQKSGDVFTTPLVGHPTMVFCSRDGNHFLFANKNKLVQCVAVLCRKLWHNYYGRPSAQAMENTDDIFGGGRSPQIDRMNGFEHEASPGSPSERHYY
ncbi:hypothetical protein KI387_018581 [Taxus chinensis]|uniref:Uncharacterized protein n=1 Tax=Taxus chinensis TaxID=29808 RepID=A0AA38GKI1_TAXCH|nr:hypothetical protein KI387_018581 [Taxus chinensis]